MMVFQEFQNKICEGDHVIMERDLNSCIHDGMICEFTGYEKCGHQGRIDIAGDCIDCKGKMCFDNHAPYCMCYGPEDTPVSIHFKNIQLEKELFEI